MFVPNKQLRVGMGQLLVEGGEPERNLERAEKMIQEVGRILNRADLVPARGYLE